MSEREQRYPVLLAYLQVYGEHQLLGDTIEGSEIVRTVMSAIDSVTSSILMTMDLAEELRSPLPADYHSLLSRKLDEGVRISRVGFGTEQEFLQIAQIRSYPSENFTFIHNPNMKDYQRMILIDRAILFFRHNGVFSRSTHLTTINQFLQYFSSVAQP